MQLKDIQIVSMSGGHQQIPDGRGGYLLGHRESDTVTVQLTYYADPAETEALNALLVPGGKTPPRAFWDALDWGHVDPEFAPPPLTHEERSEILLAEAKAPTFERVGALFAACAGILRKRMDTVEIKWPGQ